MSEGRDAGRWRVMVDANVMISFLIKPGNVTRTINRTVRIAISEQFQMIVPAELLIELRNAPQKPNLGPLLTDKFVEDFIVDTLSPAEVVLTFGQLDELEATEAVRDPKDRYLLQAAIQHDVDILVSGDKDLLALREFLEVPRILSPAEFVAEFGDG